MFKNRVAVEKKYIKFPSCIVRKYSEKLDLYAFKPLIKVLTGMRRVGKSTLLKSHAEALRKNFPSAGILAIDKESMEWDHIRTGKELHEFAIANFEGQTGPYVLMVDEVQGGIAA